MSTWEQSFLPAPSTQSCHLAQAQSHVPWVNRRAPGAVAQDAKGLMWYLAPAEAGDLVQVDLSDDLVVTMLFSNGQWASVSWVVAGRGGAG